MRRFCRGIWLVLTTDCERSARLTSESCDRRVTVFERLAVCVHNAYCKKSRNLARQLRVLDKAVRRLADQTPTPARLSAEARQRIAEKLSEIG